MRRAVAVDGHAHFHPAFSAAGFLSAAVRNACRWAPAGRAARRSPDVWLMLADPPGRDSLRALAADLEGDRRWDLVGTGERTSRVARSAGEEGVLLVAGRQIPTAEGLEVLALATDEEIPHGESARETIGRSLAAGAVTVLPWGFGKWWFRRGRSARELVEATDHPLFFLGDNGGRPRGAPDPPLFQWARRRGTAVLPGSDPLPFSHEEGRTGSYGFVLRGRGADGGSASGVQRDLSGAEAAPAAALRRRLERHDGRLDTFGRRVGVGRFVLNQIGMQIRRGRSP